MLIILNKLKKCKHFEKSEEVIKFNKLQVIIFYLSEIAKISP
jgi:hypothetical protein